MTTTPRRLRVCCLVLGLVPGFLSSPLPAAAESTLEVRPFPSDPIPAWPAAQDGAPPTLAPGEAAVAREVYLAAPRLPDEVVVTAVGDGDAMARAEIAVLAPPEPLWKMPLEGVWLTSSLPSPASHHRFHWQTEFAVDFWNVGPDGLHTAYGHLRTGSVRVRVGDEAEAGQPIAEVGDTGDTPLVHLHFQVNAGPDPLASRSLPFRFTDTRARIDPGVFLGTE